MATFLSSDDYDEDGGWEPAEWLHLDSLEEDDDGSAEADRWRRVRTIEPTGGVL